MAAKELVIYCRVTAEMKQRVQDEMERRDEGEAVIVREALREYFAKRDAQPPTVAPSDYPPHRPAPADQYNERAGTPYQTNTAPANSGPYPQEQEVEAVSRRVLRRAVEANKRATPSTASPSGATAAPKRGKAGRHTRSKTRPTPYPK